MSKLIVTMMEGDPEVFQKSLTDRADEFERFTAEARMAGAVHHRFGVGDGSVLIIDEWDTEEAFHAFFARPDLQAFIGKVGGDTSVAPEIMVTEAITSSSDF